jgi:transposase, IS605 OrfB family, central region
MQLTFKYRVKDKHARRLNAQARAVNFVWNYCNETQQKAFLDHRRWLSGYDLWKLVAGCTKEGLDLHSHSAMRVCLQYAKARKQQKKPWLRWRSKRSLGWVPFNTGHVAFRDGAFVFRGEVYRVWLDRPIPEGSRIGAGSFNQDSRGRWYLNVPVEIATASVASIEKVGIDLGLGSLVALSTGKTIEAPQFYRKSELALATAQRARKTKRARAIHAKARNRRKDFLHKESARLTQQFGLIVVGDVSPSRIARSRFAKSVLDAGWADLKQMLSYKSIRNGGSMLQVSEHLTSQTCSECGCLPPSRPRGIAGLRKRVFNCDDCGAALDRDVNAAVNILRLGLQTLVAGAPLKAGNPGLQAGE